MMSLEERFFLSCLKDFISYRKTLKPHEMPDMQRILKIAQKQDMESLIYIQCIDWIGETEVGRKLRQSLINKTYVRENRRALIQEIADACLKEGIDLICMKGAVLEGYYPLGVIRTMGDVDFIVKQEDLDVIDNLMFSLGYKRFIDNHAVWSYHLGIFEFEIHNQMFYEQLTNDVDYIGYFENAWAYQTSGQVFGSTYQNIFVPEENYHFLYLIAHTAKHISNQGCGFRPFLDIAMMINQCNLDWLWIKEELIKLKLYDFTCTCLSFCSWLFDLELPFDTDGLDETFLQNITAKMFRDGLFGLHNDENEIGKTSKDMRRSSSNYLMTSFKLTLQKIFPPYHDMQLIPHYAFVDHRPWLMPAAWVYRWGYCLLHKRHHSIELLKEPFSKRKEIEERETLLEKWGL